MQCFGWKRRANRMASLIAASGIIGRIKQEVEMMLSRNRLTLVFAAMFLLQATTSQADNRKALRFSDDAKPAIAPASIASSDVGNPTPAVGPACRIYKPCVTYRGCCDSCGQSVNQTLMVPDPCDDCCCTPSRAEISVCLPACCKNPCINCKCGLFGRGVVTYSYDCGCCVTIVFRNGGDVIVKYSG
jgi:hypothetical protein